VASDEFVAPPRRGRRFESRARVRLADVSPTGRVRLDAIARMLQDVSGDDTVDAAQAPDAAWVVRRIVIEFNGRQPRLRDDVALLTWCSGTGARWAERRTDLARVGADGSSGDVFARASALWVLVDAETGRPLPLPAGFDAVYGEAAAGRKVGQRLRHGPPPADAPRVPWSLRVTDFDVLGHVNNAAYWEPVEEMLAALAPKRWLARAELEFRGGLDPPDVVELIAIEADATELRTWLTVGPDVRASAVVQLLPAGSGEASGASA
jgi:acyl-ACP thioesterase